jgi:hypothetical protein
LALFARRLCSCDVQFFLEGKKVQHCSWKYRASPYRILVLDLFVPGLHNFWNFMQEPKYRRDVVGLYDCHTNIPEKTIGCILLIVLKECLQKNMSVGWLLGAFVQFWNATVNFVVSVFPSVCRRGTTRLALRDN